MNKWLHSVYEPFFNRRTDHKSAELQETEELYRRASRLHARFKYSDEEVLKARRYELFEPIEEQIPQSLRSSFYATLTVLLRMEQTIFELPEFHPSLSLKEMVEFRDALRRKEHFHTNEKRILDLLEESVINILAYIAAPLPETFDPSPFNIPLIYALPEPKKLVTDLFGTFWNQSYIDAGLYVEVSRQMHLNICAASGITNTQEPNKPFKLPTQNDAPLDEIVSVYLKDTPFEMLFTQPVPLRITHEERFNHMHIVGGSGAGKTQLLQNLILHDIQSDAALVIVDSQGDLIDKLSHLEGIEDRLVLITPKDIDHPPALNIFDIDRGRLRTYDALVREQVTAGVIETFDYLFTGLIGADLTAKQGVFFRYVARLMLALPPILGRNATILDMINLMDDIEPYREAIQSLPDIQRRFFIRDFTSKTFDQTKEQIRYRLQAIIENPTIARLFTSPSTKIDLFTELNNGSIILVDTAKDFLKSSSSHFGRIFISLILQAVLERAVIPEDERKPAFLIVDEAADYFDDNIDDLLTEARKYKLGCCFAHQHLDQCTPSLRASFAANTGIKMAGGVSSSDARVLAPDMRTSADFILSQPRRHFACHIRNVTPQAVSIPIEVGKLEAQPRLSDGAYEEMRKRNRERVAVADKPEPVKPPPEEPQQKAEPPPRRHEFRPQEPIRDAAEPSEPRAKRKRPKKRHGPLSGDIDTSA